MTKGVKGSDYHKVKLEVTCSWREGFLIRKEHFRGTGNILAFDLGGSDVVISS